MMKRLSTEQQITLEQLIDRCGLANVVSAVADICGEKAEHIRENWQDESTAFMWDKAGEFLEIASQQEKITRVSR